MITLDYLKLHGKRYSKIARINMNSDIQRNIDVIDEMYSAGINKKENIAYEISERIRTLSSQKEISDEELQEEVNFLSENDPSDEIIELIEEMQIVSLYKSVEITIIKMLNISGLLPDKEQDFKFSITKLENFYKHHDLNIKELEGFSAFDELRLINNCVKHSGRVNKPLSKYPHWNLEDKVTNCSAAYDRLKQDVQKFVLALGDALHNQIA
ncbi:MULTISPECIES: hypothetical protein [unclassified Aliivibrio]|uniref:hypothetical protein n=1 Tax=unclassified Aliivibrio TaxID=2645654 RepID=UPI00114678D5|nr:MULTISPECIES: hypothetical protein [unclassified Aliivibrio]